MALIVESGPPWVVRLDGPGFATHSEVQAAVDALAALIAQRMPIPTGTSAQYLRGDGSIAAMPIIQSRRMQTDAAGALTWVFPVPFPEGVTPVVELTVEDSSPAVWNHQIVAISNTSVTVKLTKSSPVTVLSVQVLGIAASPQAFVHLTASYT